MNQSATQTAMITGASAGLGRAVALRLALAGTRLILVARRATILAELADQIREAGGEAEIWVCDLAETASVEKLAAYLGQCEPAVDVLVNCAGVKHNVPFVISDTEDWLRDFQINTLAPMRLAQAFGKRLRRLRREGCLVNLASVAALVGAPNAAVYCATKGALVAWGRALAAEWARSNIRVLLICPGYVRTEMLEQARRELTSEAMAALEAAHPLGFGEPEDVAELVTALIGPAGRWMTGSIITLDGGYTAV